MGVQRPPGVNIRRARAREILAGSTQWEIVPMGLSPFRPSEARTSSDTPVPDGNPNPKNFKILRSVDIGSYVVAEIHYPDSNNYEGHKICVYDNGSSQMLSRYVELDPHFVDPSERTMTPIARFRPDEKGWAMACAFAAQWGTQRT